MNIFVISQGCRRGQQLLQVLSSPAPAQSWGRFQGYNMLSMPMQQSPHYTELRRHEFMHGSGRPLYSATPYVQRLENLRSSCSMQPEQTFLDYADSRRWVLISP